ncbi:Aste57867_21274 [Aphanomyces stellatus]|uniref:Aste57867_21274 protein n=1 Tax=Aphanomyces stellatus TaxID=120398 RepID=A0A485LH22_9STRA|nr:hypothetical protein As57867_021205 [Aphanomyces stellatus]VFT97946.1 Aste57867_21274 [Aphanomyces stellatus]
MPSTLLNGSPLPPSLQLTLLVAVVGFFSLATVWRITTTEAFLLVNDRVFRDHQYGMHVGTPPNNDTLPPPSTIPRLIHQSWKTADAIPSQFDPWMQSWRTFNPTWDYMFWDDADNLQLFQTYFPEYYPMATQLSKISLADMARYAMLYHYGGVYADADFECLQSFDDLIDRDLFLSFEPLVHSVLLEGATQPVLCNAILASRPKHPFWLHVLQQIKHRFETNPDRDPVSLTGPRIVNAAVATVDVVKMNISLLPEEYFYPEIAYWNLGNLQSHCGMPEALDATKRACSWLQKYPKGRRTAKTHAVHHWQHTWGMGDRATSYVSLNEIFPRDDVWRPTF